MAKKKQNVEYETKVLDIDPEEIKAKLRKLGAKETPEVLMKRWVFDRPGVENKWFRLRFDGFKNTITFKERTSDKIGDTEEIEVDITDFEQAAKILHKMDFPRQKYQENRRQTFRLDNIEFCLDYWPLLDPHLEIESDSIKGVEKGLELLDLTGKDIGNVSVYDLYDREGIDMHATEKLIF